LTVPTPGARPLLVISLQSRPGWRRIGLDTEAQVARQIGDVEKQGAEFEHAYDY
jgi:hypothetical protein